jgi:hypothetical protein
MGSFSWITQDTQESIAVENPKSVYMLDNKGNKWEESKYQGYGVFGGKDFYQLVAEMNVEFYPHLKLTGDVDKDRDIGIDLAYGNRPYLSPNLYHNGNREWKNEAPADCEHQGYPPEDATYGDYW